MGTRNITRVISNGQLKVCQYCQWDGYPTGAGRDIINFIRNSDDEHMVERLEHVTLVTDVEGRVFCTGAPVFEEADAISDDELVFRTYLSKEYQMLHPDNGSSIEEFEYIKRRFDEMIMEKYGPELVQKWHIAIRDTGCAILPLIYESTNDLTVYSDEELVSDFGDASMIESVWQLDYDSKTLTGWWHGFKDMWSFSQLRERTEEEIDNCMSDYEQVDLVD